DRRHVLKLRLILCQRSLTTRPSARMKKPAARLGPVHPPTSLWCAPPAKSRVYHLRDRLQEDSEQLGLDSRLDTGRVRPRRLCFTSWATSPVSCRPSRGERRV